LEGSDATDSLLTFFQAVISDTPRPRFSWTKQKDGTLVVRPVDAPTAVSVWQATNPDTRDFRVDTIGKAYKASPLKAKNGVYTTKVGRPKKGYTAFFVELVYPGPGKTPYKFTTEVSVVPDVLPYKWQDAK
jgi:PhoPQ-activated pathogenicity-related protein